MGGMKKEIKVPISMPNRVIIEPDQPRQSFSDLTWEGLNKYYLKKVLSKKEYLAIIGEFKKIQYNVYEQNRDEDQFNGLAYFKSISRVIMWIGVVPFLLVLVSEITDLSHMSFDNRNWLERNFNLILCLLVIICSSLVFMVSYYNFVLQPPDNIFVSYETFLRGELNKHFVELNE